MAVAVMTVTSVVPTVMVTAVVAAVLPSMSKTLKSSSASDPTCPLQAQRQRLWSTNMRRAHPKKLYSPAPRERIIREKCDARLT